MMTVTELIAKLEKLAERDPGAVVRIEGGEWEVFDAALCKDGVRLATTHVCSAGSALTQHMAALSRANGESPAKTMERILTEQSDPVGLMLHYCQNAQEHQLRRNDRLRSAMLDDDRLAEIRIRWTPAFKALYAYSEKEAIKKSITVERAMAELLETDEVARQLYNACEEARR